MGMGWKDDLFSPQGRKEGAKTQGEQGVRLIFIRSVHFTARTQGGRKDANEGKVQRG